MADDPPPRRKLIAFDQETWQALDVLARDSFKTLQELADEAFADLLRKHNRPTDLKQAPKKSAGGAQGAGTPPRRRGKRVTSASRPARRRASRAAE